MSVKVQSQLRCDEPGCGCNFIAWGPGAVHDQYTPSGAKQARRQAAAMGWVSIRGAGMAGSRLDFCTLHATRALLDATGAV